MAGRYRKADRQDDSTECLRVISDDEINNHMAGVDMATSKLRPKNTNNQYMPTILEFKASCHLKYAGEGDNTVSLFKKMPFLKGSPFGSKFPIGL
jgi:hypothetical protein